jgi:hypothetical protein
MLSTRDVGLYEPNGVTSNLNHVIGSVFRIYI